MATQSNILGESQGQRSLVGYSPQSNKELDTPEDAVYIHFSLLIEHL